MYPPETEYIYTEFPLSPNCAQPAFPQQGRLIHLVISFHLPSSATSDSLYSTFTPAPHFLLHGTNISQFLFKKKWHLHCHDVSLISFMLSSQVSISLLCRQRTTEYMGQTHFSACAICHVYHEVNTCWLCGPGLCLFVSPRHIQVIQSQASFSEAVTSSQHCYSTTATTPNKFSLT